MLQVALGGHRLRSSVTWDGTTEFAIDYAAIAGTIKDALLASPADGIAHQSDGTWRTDRCTDVTGQLNLNTFYNALIMVELAKYYEQIEQDPDIITAVAACWNTIYDTYWGLHGQSVESFHNNFDNGCLGGGESIDLTLMYPAAAYWLYLRTGTASYLTEADDVFSEGVGIGTGGAPKEGPAYDEIGLYARKIMGEAHVHSLIALGWRAAA
jgi:hypothetical protein